MLSSKTMHETDEE